MSDKPEKPPEKPLGPQPKAERTAREAAALRENLRKRKEQARQREESRKADQ
jgi:hypothetical protein